MSLRAIQEFVVHVESFRNIDLWYQGAYLLSLQVYMEIGPEKQREVLYLLYRKFTLILLLLQSITWKTRNKE